MAKIPIILEPGRADGKLIKTNSVYDDNQEKFLSDKIKEIDDNHNILKDNVNTLTEVVNNNESDIEFKLETEKTRATNAENNLRETINNITEISGSSTTANVVTIDTIPNTSSSNVQQALNELFNANEGLNNAIAAEQERAEAAEQANADAIDTLGSNISELESEINELHDVTDNEKYSEVFIDKENKMLESRDSQGNKTFYTEIYAPNIAYKEELEQKQDVLNFDSMPQKNSNNPVTSSGIHSFIDKFFQVNDNANVPFSSVLVDTEGKMLESRDKEGNKTFYTNIFAPNVRNVEIKENIPFSSVLLDKDGKMLESRDENGGKTSYTDDIFKSLKGDSFDCKEIGQNLDAIISEKIGVKTYSNPIYLGNGVPDPTIWNGGDGYWYCFYTCQNHTNCTILRSTNLVDWDNTEDKFMTDEDFEALGAKELWAPSVIKIGDKWTMYFTQVDYPEEGKTEGKRKIIVLQSKLPYGLFKKVGEFANKPSTGFVYDFIDPFVTYDRDGSLWMVFGSNSNFLYQLSDDGLSVKSGTTWTHIAGVADTYGQITGNEGCYLYRRKGYWYLFASCGNWTNGTYSICVGRSRTIDGVYLDKQGRDMRQGYSTIIMQSPSGTLYGCGHNGEIFESKDGKTYIFFHAWYIKDTTSRKLCMQELKWDDDGFPYFENSSPKLIDVKPNF